MRKINFIILTIILPIFSFSQEIIEHQEKERKNETSIFIGSALNDDRNSAVVGFDYQYRLSKTFGIGATVVDITDTENRSVLIGPALFVHVWHFEFVGVFAAEFSEENTVGVFRLGVSYVIELNRFSISPQIFYDSERDEKASYVAGINFGFKF